MTSRRVMLTAGAAVIAGAAVVGRETGRLDDVLRGLGARPHPEPDAGDVGRVRRAAIDQGRLVAGIDAVLARHSDLAGPLGLLADVAHQQLAAVDGTTAAVDLATPPADAAAAVTAVGHQAALAARERASDAVEAVSPEVARLLASMSAGLAQLGRSLKAVA